MRDYPNSFSQRALEHLSRYKEEVLQIAEPGTFKYRGEELAKRHILPKEQQLLNLLPLVRGCFATLSDTAGKKLRWHRYFHHLNSSQALAVNLFQPFLTSAIRKSRLAMLLGLAEPLKSCGFEHVPDEREGTNVDFFAEGADGSSLVVEVKFTEIGFGTASDDEEHRVKYADLYEERITRIAELGPSAREEFFAAYQFFRNALYARENAATRVWFMVPRDNQGVRLAAERNMRQLKAEIAASVEVVELEKFIDRAIAESVDDVALTTHFGEFKRKYIIPGSTKSHGSAATHVS